MIKNATDTKLQFVMLKNNKWNSIINVYYGWDVHLPRIIRAFTVHHILLMFLWTNKLISFFLSFFISFHSFIFFLSFDSAPVQHFNLHCIQFVYVVSQNVWQQHLLLSFGRCFLLLCTTLPSEINGIWIAVKTMRFRFVRYSKRESLTF